MRILINGIYRDATAEEQDWISAAHETAQERGESTTSGENAQGTEQLQADVAELKSTLAAVSTPAMLGGICFAVLAESEDIPDAEIAKYPTQFAQWQSGEKYEVKAIREYGGKLYRCLQAHTAQDDWTPDTSVSLWREIADPTAEYPAWAQPLGAADAYEQGAKVSHKGKNWISNVANNVWEPSVYGWDEVTA